MKKYKKNYLKSIGAYPSDFVPCEVCGRVAVDVHHIAMKGIGGRKDADGLDNLIGLCRACHSRSHGIGHLSAFSMDYLLGIAKKRIERISNKGAI